MVSTNQKAEAAGRATRRDVAERAKVSVATVSNVVNGTKRVEPDTEARVREAIEFLGYRPNRVAAALSTGSAHLLGLIAPDLTNPFFAELSERIEVEARNRGYSVILANSLGDPEMERANTADLESRQVDAVIIATVLHPDELKTPRPHRVREVYIENSDVVDGASRVGTDLGAGATAAVEHLLSHGHETVAILGGDVDDPTRLDARVAAWRDSLARHGRPQGQIIRSDFTRQGAWVAMKEAIASGSIPPAIFATSDLQAIGALRALNEAGLRVPEDVAIVGFDDIDDGQFCWPPLTTIRQPTDQMAIGVVDAALRVDDTPVRLVFIPQIVIRRSCGCDVPATPLSD